MGYRAWQNEKWRWCDDESWSGAKKYLYNAFCEGHMTAHRLLFIKRIKHRQCYRLC